MGRHEDQGHLHAHPSRLIVSEFANAAARRCRAEVRPTQPAPGASTSRAPGRPRSQLAPACCRHRPLPKAITVDHGTEFTSRALDDWAWRRGAQFDFIRPGKPVENGLCESFQWPPARRMPERHRVHVARSRPGRAGSMAAPLQSQSATQFAAQPDPARIRTARSGHGDRRSQRFLPLNCLKTGPGSSCQKSPVSAVYWEGELTGSLCKTTGEPASRMRRLRAAPAGATRTTGHDVRLSSRCPRWGLARAPRRMHGNLGAACIRAADASSAPVRCGPPRPCGGPRLPARRTVAETQSLMLFMTS